MGGAASLLRGAAAATVFSLVMGRDVYFMSIDGIPGRSVVSKGAIDILGIKHGVSM